MANLIPDDDEHFMQSYLGPEGYVCMSWPKKLSLVSLLFMRESVNLQIDAFIKFSKKESAKEEAARLEYESWFVTKESGT